MLVSSFTLNSTDLQIIDEDFIALDTAKGNLAISYDQMLDLIAQLSQAVEKMDELGLERLHCPECQNHLLT